VKVGDLVQYCDASQGHVGIVIDYIRHGALKYGQYKVRWSDHAGYERYWYREDELVKL
jgi:uncharacterized protein YodC (DUF2158 family)